MIHGAWHGGWAWDGVIAELEKSGHKAMAPTMPGHNLGDNRSCIVFEDYAVKVADTLAEQPGPVMLAGHTSGGFMIQAAASGLSGFLVLRPAWTIVDVSANRQARRDAADEASGLRRLILFSK